MGKVLALVLAVLAFLAVAPGYGAEWDRWSLERVRDARVLVEDLPEDFKEHGVSCQQLKTDVELKLRSAGYTITDDSDSVLYVQVDGVVSDFAVIFHVSVSFLQPVLLLRDIERLRGMILHDDLIDVFSSRVASTWSAGRTGYVGVERNPARSIRDAVSDLVDMYSNDWLAARQDLEAREQQFLELTE
jgi:hypothetical protein